MANKIKVLKSYEDVESYIDFVRQGADKERNALGFLPPNAYRQAAEQGKLFVAVDDADEFLGHLMFGGVFPLVKVMQIYSCPEFRNHGVAQAIMDELINYAQERGYLSLSAKVASDLSEANAFYQRMGFHIVSTFPGGKTRNRLIYHRVRDLDTLSLFDLLGPKEHELLPNLGISANYSTKTPIYAIDLNVLFDVSKQRVRSEDAGMVFNAGFSNDIRPVIAEEFIEELHRSSQKFPNDPHLQLALQMNVLPTPKPKLIKDVEGRLAEIIFPERASRGILTIQDKSDLRHLAAAVHHKITGFITSENAILRAHDKLQSEFELDVLGVSDFAEAMSSGDNGINQHQIARTEETELACSQLTDGMSKAAHSFLSGKHVPLKTMNDALSEGDYVSPQKHVILSGESGIISFASWHVTQSPRKMANVFLCANEGSTAAKTAIDHTLDRICRAVSSGAPARMCLHILPGHPVTKKIALAHGFRSEQGQEEYGTTLHKVAVGCVIDEKSWGSIRRSLKSLTDVGLPANIPRYENPEQSITVKTSSGQDKAIPLRELEILLSPAIILLPGRYGAIVSIRRVFADELLGTGEQFSLLTSPEAVFLKERVYYNTPRAASILAPGTPILFYESSDGGGRKSIVAVGRATESHILTGDQVNSDMRRRGVLDTEALQCIGNSEAKLVTAFDNIMAFKKPVHLYKLREIGCADGANFVTAKRIEPHHLIRVINEGLNDE
ncbi:MAG: GNAT family N-acetyltransferase [Alphaproteobacteria bacterium]